MNPQNTTIIVGPPGTGKTYTLLQTVEKLLGFGYTSREICFITFTRKAAGEAKMRALEKFQLQLDDIPYFSTFHSLAFKQMGMGRHQIMGQADYLSLCGQLGLSITFRGASEDGTVTGMSKGDRLFFAENMARAQLMPLREYWEKHVEEDIYWYELELLAKTMLSYKAVNGKQDFTDIIHNFCANPVVPNCKILIIDEAQDLTPLQWQMAEHLAKDMEEVYIAGDDDQAIFHWAGADSSRFRELQGNRVILPQSFRVPIAVQKIAETVVQRISTRIAKDWKSTEAEGKVEHVNHLEHIDMSIGTWLLLARNAYLLRAYNEHCTQMGLVFESHLGSPIRGAALQAIVAWEQLRKGHQVSILTARAVYDYISVKVGVKHGFKTKLDKAKDSDMVSMKDLELSYGLVTREIWHIALDRIVPEEREYFLSALRRGEKLLKEPRIRINTIHGVKGGEADHVVVQTDMAERTWREYQENMDDEHRVWYVAVTRAKKSLWILSPQTDKCYDI